MSLIFEAANFGETLRRRAVSPDNAWRFADRFESRQVQARLAAKKRLAWLAFIWLVSLGVAKGAVRSGAIGAFALADISTVLLVSPLFMAMLWHDAVAMAVLENLFENLAIACALHANAGLDVAELEALRFSGDSASAEGLFDRFVSGRAGWVFHATSLVVLTLTLWGPLAGIVHVSFLLLTSPAFNLWLRVACIVLTAIVSARTVGIAYVWLRRQPMPKIGF